MAAAMMVNPTIGRTIFPPYLPGSPLSSCLHAIKRMAVHRDGNRLRDRPLRWRAKWQRGRIIMDSLIAAFTDPTAIAALIALVVMEVVLGIDNLVFISILTNKLPVEQRQKA